MSSSESSKDRFAPLTYEQMYCVEEPEPDGRPLELEIDSLVPFPNQPFDPYTEDEMAQLVESIQENGVISPITLRDNGDGTYMIIAGERRFRASKMAGLERIPAYIRTAKDEQVMEWALIENIQREDLNAIELATAYAKLKTQFNLSDEDIAAKVGKSEASVRTTMRLLNLPEDVKKIMVKEKLTEGVKLLMV